MFKRNLTTQFGAATSAILGLLAWSPAANGQCEEVIPLANPSFESPALADGQSTICPTQIPGWDISCGFPGNNGVWNPPAAQYPGGAPDGQNVAYIWGVDGPGGNIFVQMAASGYVFELGRRYTLTVDVGLRSSSTPAPAYAAVSLIARSITQPILAARVWVDGGTPGEFQTVTVTYEPQPGDPAVGQRVGVQLASMEFAPAEFDNVRLTMTRLPGDGSSCDNELVCYSQRWSAEGCGGDVGCYASSQGRRSYVANSSIQWSSELATSLTDYTGNLYVAGSGLDPFQQPTYIIVRYTAQNGTIDDPNNWNQFPVTSPGGTRTLRNAVLGPDNHIYLIGLLDTGGAPKTEVVKLDETGSLEVRATIPNATPGDIAVSEDGYVFASFFQGGMHVTRAYKPSQSGLQQVWEFVGAAAVESAGSKLLTDESGNVHAIYAKVPVLAARTRIEKLNHKGKLSQSWPDDGLGVHGIGVREFQGQFLTAVLGTDGKLFVSIAYDSVNGRIWGFSREGAFENNLWTPGHQFLALATNRAGHLAAAGKTTGAAPDFSVAKWRAENGSGFHWMRTFNGGLSDIATRVAFDRLGNVYAAGRSDISAGNTDIVVVKYSTETSDWPGDPNDPLSQYNICPDGGCKSWFENTNPAGVWREMNASSDAFGLHVLGMGDVYFSFIEHGVGGGGGNQDAWTTIRLGQPWMSTPLQIINNSLSFTALGQSIWTEGAGDIRGGISVVPPGGDPNSTLDLPSVDISIGDTISFFGDDYGAEGSIEADNLAAGLAIRANLSGGTVDINYPMTVELRGPGSPDELLPGTAIQLVSACQIDPAAAMQINPIAVEFGLTGTFAASLRARIAAVVADHEIFDETFELDGNPGTPQLDPVVFSDYILRAEDLLDVQHGNYQREFDLGPLVSGYVRLPQIAPFAMVEGNLDDCLDRDMIAQGRDVMLSLTADQLTNYITSQFGILTAYDIGYSQDGVGLELELAVLQFVADFNLYLDQEFTYTAREPFIQLNSPDLGSPLLFHPSEGVTFTMPADGVITFYPEIFVPTDLDNFENRTKLVLEPAVGFDTARAGLSVDLGPISIGDDVCLGCERWATPVDFDVYHANFRLGNGGAFARVALPPVTMIGDNTNVPELVSASRESLPVWFYDQLRVDDPNSNVQSQFDEFVEGSTALVLYGRRFREEGPCVTLHTHFWIHGHEEELDTTWIDANTLRVDFPNRLRLIPGLGRFWVETDGFDADGAPVPRSNTLDFLITYPRPNIIKAAPSLWAADPDFRDVLMTVVDGGTALGGESFIKRIDYWVRLAELWAASPTSTESIDAYFTEVNFYSLPPMPLILWNGLPLTTYNEPDPSGLLWAQIPVNYFSAPVKAGIRVMNPGPGGGTSNLVSLTVAAPEPQLCSIDPPAIRPGAATFDMIVLGPPNVVEGTDYCNGTQDMRFQSNFNAASIVRWDGADLPTKFISSSRLIATVDAAFVATTGDHNITVFTPANGTTYFDLPDPNDPNATEFDSGGTSNAAIFQIINPPPLNDPNSVITILPGRLFAGYLDTPGPRPAHDLIVRAQTIERDEYGNRVSVDRESFTPETVVLWEGQPRTTVFVSPSQLEVLLEPEDVRTIGDFNVTIETPAPGGGSAGPYTVSVVACAGVVNVPADFATIQAAIYGSCDGAEIVVAPGTYFENIDFLGKDITVRSASGPLVSTIDGQSLDSVVRFESGETSAARLEGFTIRNGAVDGGGGLRIHDASPTVVACRIQDNSTTVSGGGAELLRSQSVFINCAFVRNTSHVGGGVYVFDAAPTLINCVWYDNTATLGSGAAMQVSGAQQAIVYNSIAWGNTPAAFPLTGFLDVSYSVVEGGMGGAGNLDADPMFRNAAGGDLRLAECSPAIDAGDNTAVPAGVTLDGLNQPRFVDDVGVADTGNGTAPIVDMGPTEVQAASDCGSPCLGDLDGDGQVALGDLSILLANYGTASGALPEDGDLNGDGDVDLEDLAQLLSIFGTPCP